MTTKRKNTIAIVVVLLIWGYVALKLFDYFGAEEPAVTYDAPMENTIEKLFKKDTFDLRLDYDDPFLKSKPVQRRTIENRPKPIVKKPAPGPKKEVVKPWPEVVFNGMIQSSGSKEPLGMLTVASKGHLVRSGDIVAGVKVVSLSASSVELEYKGERKTVQ